MTTSPSIVLAATVHHTGLAMDPFHKEENFLTPLEVAKVVNDAYLAGLEAAVVYLKAQQTAYIPDAVEELEFAIRGARELKEMDAR